MQTMKGLRLVNITFDGNLSPEHIRRLNCNSLTKQKRRSDSSPSKHATSPTKDTADEVRTNYEVNCKNTILL